LHIPTIVIAIGIAAVITGVYLGTAMTERRIINDCLERQEARVTVMRIACPAGAGVEGGAMTEQEENDLICEKLLGWTREPGNRYTSNMPYWRENDSVRTPSFTTWADAGLILDAFERIHLSDYPDSTKRSILFERDMTKHASMPLAIRATALEYIRSLP